MRRTDLTILVGKPFKSSRLAIPPSPFSPRSPITPPTKTQTAGINVTTTLTRFNNKASPPSKPVPWVWQCHICRRVYSLGVTRRCLDDGHNFCSGTSSDTRKRRKSRRTARHQACGSEFDYDGWQAWGDWRRELEAMQSSGSGGGNSEAVPHLSAMAHDEPSPRWQWGLYPLSGASRKKNCWGSCNYPSECRWGKRPGAKKQSSTNSHAARPEMSPTVAPIEDASEGLATTKPKTTFDEILSATANTPSSHSSPLASLDDPKDDLMSPKLDGSGYTLLAPLSPVQTTSIDTAERIRSDDKPGMQRRKRHSLGRTTSPSHSDPTFSSEPSIDVTLPDRVYCRDKSGHKTPRSSAHYLARPFDDIDVAKARRALAHTNDLMLSFWDTMRHTAGSQGFDGETGVGRRKNST